MRAFYFEQSQFEHFVDRFPIYDEKVVQSDEFRELAAVVFTQGVTRIRYYNGGVMFLFAGMPPDDVAEIIYSPKGRNGLPPAPRGGMGKLVEERCLCQHWYYRLVSE